MGQMGGPDGDGDGGGGGGGAPHHQYHHYQALLAAVQNPTQGVGGLHPFPLPFHLPLHAGAGAPAAGPGPGADADASSAHNASASANANAAQHSQPPRGFTDWNASNSAFAAVATQPAPAPAPAPATTNAPFHYNLSQSYALWTHYMLSKNVSCSTYPTQHEENPHTLRHTHIPEDNPHPLRHAHIPEENPHTLHHTRIREENPHMLRHTHIKEENPHMLRHTHIKEENPHALCHTHIPDKDPGCASSLGFDSFTTMSLGPNICAHMTPIEGSISAEEPENSEDLPAVVRSSDEMDTRNSGEVHRDTAGTLPESKQSRESCASKFNSGEYQVILRKELTKSDVANSGRIVLPKKDAEAGLPPLVQGDPLILQMDDMVLPIIWKFKYRFWPNNKSRMYILEAAGEFVKTHGLQAGDALIIYKNSVPGKFIIRGEKSIQQNP